jgi:alcohol dehydrogenase
LGGFVEGYGDKARAQEAVELLGLADAAALRSYLRQLLGDAQLPAELLQTGAAKLLEDPAKLKNYPFVITAEELVGMVN